MVTRGAGAAGAEAGRTCGIVGGRGAGATAEVVTQWTSATPPAATMTISMAKAMTGCSPYVLRVKCTHDGNFITARLLCPACQQVAAWVAAFEPGTVVRAVHQRVTGPTVEGSAQVLASTACAEATGPGGRGFRC